MNINLVEAELKKRHTYIYKWGLKQNDAYDKQTNFIYNIKTFEELLGEIKRKFGNQKAPGNIANYAINRWYNFVSAAAVENIFCSLPNVIPAKDSKDRLVDFSINGITFDHKTSVYPKNFTLGINEARKKPEVLIKWLYKNQSQQQRKHLKNRLFIVLHNNNGEHWKLKAEVKWLQKLIEDYVKIFDKNSLKQFEFEKEVKTYSDIIWAVME